MEVSADGNVECDLDSYYIVVLAGGGLDGGAVFCSGVRKQTRDPGNLCRCEAVRRTGQRDHIRI
jgi:hypothetical protein